MSFVASRTIAAPPARVLAAFEDVDRVKLWWGPAGFTSTFDTFAFVPGGRWKLTLHGPDGKNYPNELVVKEIEPPSRVVIDHISQPRYLLTVTLQRTADGGTLIGWEQDFENPEVERRMDAILKTANSELLDRLSAEVLRANT